MTDPIWRLEIEKGRVVLYWTQKDQDHILDLGDATEAMENMTWFLAEQDFEG